MKIVIIVEGGVVQEVLADLPYVTVEIVDRDNLAESVSAQDAAEIERVARASAPHETA